MVFRYGVPKYRRADTDPMDSIEFLHEYENEFPEAPISNVPPGISFSKLDKDEQELRAEEIYPLVKLLEKLQVCCKKCTV